MHALAPCRVCCACSCGGSLVPPCCLGCPLQKTPSLPTWHLQQQGGKPGLHALVSLGKGRGGGTVSAHKSRACYLLRATLGSAAGGLRSLPLPFPALRSGSQPCPLLLYSAGGPANNGSPGNGCDEASYPERMLCYLPAQPLTCQISHPACSAAPSTRFRRAAALRPPCSRCWRVLSGEWARGRGVGELQ